MTDKFVKLKSDYPSLFASINNTIYRNENYLENSLRKYAELRIPNSNDFRLKCSFGE